MAWSKIFEYLDIDPEKIDKVGPHIENKTFKKLNLNPNRHIPLYTNSQRKRIVGDYQDLWPLRTGIGECVLIRGNMIVNNDYDPNYVTKISTKKLFLINNLKDVSTEREALVQGFNLDLFRRLLKYSDEQIYLGPAGKLYLAEKINYYEEIELKGLQFELDWSIETEKEILVIEAKFSAKGLATKELQLLQVFFPSVYLNKKLENKKIRPFFLDVIKTDSYVDFHFMEIGYEDIKDLKTYKTTPINSTTFRYEF